MLKPSDDIRVDFLEGETLSLPGRLGMTILPGVKDPGRWDRELDTDLKRLKQEYGTDSLVVLLEHEEFEIYGVPDLLKRARQVGLETVEFPIKDVDTPQKAQSTRYEQLIERLILLIREGKTIVVHCRGGLGRTGMVAASVLVAASNCSADEAIGIVRSARSERAVETSEQEEYVRSFEREWRTKHLAGAESGRRVYGDDARGKGLTPVQRYRGCLLGLAVGDALGTTVEFKPVGTFEPVEDIVGGGPFGLRPGEWTDDTSMALCLAKSLIEMQAFDPVDQMAKYLRWYREGHMSVTGAFVDIGTATSQALELFEETGEPYAGSTDPYSAGNGSIMRLAPVPMFYAQLPVTSSSDGEHLETVERSGESSRTTHGAPTTVDACRYLGSLIAGAVNGAQKEELLSERYSPVGPGYWEERPLVPEIDEIALGSFKHREPPEEIEGSGYVVRSLEAALWAFHKSDSYKEGALLAVNLGDDADTTGAVYGQLAGAYYGEESIPRSWRRKLAHRLLIEHFAESLFRLGSLEKSEG